MELCLLITRTGDKSSALNSIESKYLHFNTNVLNIKLLTKERK